MPAGRVITVVDVERIDKDHLVVTQANKAVRSAYSMSLQEKRLLLLVISLIRRDDKDFKLCRISIKQVQEHLGINNKNVYKIVEDVASKLMSRVVSIQTDDGGWEKFQWISHARYVPKGRQGNKEGAYLEIRLHDQMAPLLLELKSHFQSIPFLQLANLSSFYTIRLFEILFHGSHGMKRSKVSIPLEELREHLELGTKYSEFRAFRRRVLEPAQQEILEKTVLSFEFESVKQSNRVVALDFVVKANPLYKEKAAKEEAKTVDVEDQEALLVGESELISELENLKYKQAASVIKKHGVQAIGDVLEVAKKRQQEAKDSGNPIRNMPAFIAYLIKHKAWEDVASERAEQAQKENKERKQAKEKQLKQLADETGDKYFKACRDYVRSTWEALDPKVQEHVHDEMKAKAKGFELKSLERYGYQGLFYEITRRRALEDMGLVKLPKSLKTIATYAKKELDLPKAKMTALLAEFKSRDEQKG